MNQPYFPWLTLPNFSNLELLTSFAILSWGSGKFTGFNHQRFRKYCSESTAQKVRRSRPKILPHFTQKDDCPSDSINEKSFIFREVEVC